MSNLVTYDEMQSMASHIVRSRLFGAKDESQAISLMLLAQAEGCHPMQAIQDFDIVQGRPARKTHSILARFQAAGGSVKWEEITEKRAAATFSHKLGGDLFVEWTFEQAQKIGLTSKDNWKNYPKAMLRARCIAEGVRAVYPGALGGMLAVEEAQDIEPGMVDINPRPQREDPVAIANQTLVTEQNEEREQLMADMDSIADLGTDELKKGWERLTSAQRKLHGGLTKSTKDRAARADEFLKAEQANE